jgi:hypothetical protein
MKSEHTRFVVPWHSLRRGCGALANDTPRERDAGCISSCNELRRRALLFLDSNLEEHAIMKHGMSSLRGPALAGALLLGSGCIILPEAIHEGDEQTVQIVMDIRQPNGAACTVSSDGQDGACNGVIATRGRAMVNAVVDWSRDEPESLVVIDDCAGRFEVSSSAATSFQAEWVAPVVPRTCVITASATSKDGARSELSTVLMVQGDGPIGFPRISAKLSHGNDTCVLAAGQTDVACGPISSGGVVQSSVVIDWGTLSQGTISVAPTCSRQFVDPVDDGSSFQSAWYAPLIDTPSCEVTFEAVSDEGPFTVARMSYSIVDGQPPGEVYAYVYLEHTDGQCFLDPGAFATECGAIEGGAKALVYVEIDWGKDAPGSITVGDTCNGSFATTFSSETSEQLDWSVPADATTCTVQVEATTDGGELRTFEMLVSVN